MASIKDLFIKSISEGMKAAEMIPDASNKATAYAELAKALALTGQVRNDKNAEAEPAGKESLKPEATKGRSKKKETPVVEETVEEIVEETPAEEVVEEAVEETVEEATQEEVEEVEELAQEAETEAAEISDEVFTEEWTDESLAALSDEIEFIGYLKENYEESTINECITAFSEGLFNTLDDINPLNIKGFVAYMQCLISEAE